MRVHIFIKNRSLLLVKDMTEKKNLTSNNCKMNNYIFNVKQMKMNKLIKYIFQLIISASNATLEVLLLRPCF